MVKTKKTRDQNTENQILVAAKKIFQAKGMDGARMQEIADEAGINKAMLHYYYRNKQQLFEAVFENAFSLLAPQLNSILNDDSSVEEKIKKFTNNYITFISKHPYLPNFIIQELNRNPDFFISLKEKTKYPNLKKFRKQIEEEIEKGNLKPVNPEQLFINIIALNVFPFVAKPLLKIFIDINEAEYNNLIEERKKEVSSFIMDSIKKR